MRRSEVVSWGAIVPGYLLLAYLVMLLTSCERSAPRVISVTFSPLVRITCNQDPHYVLTLPVAKAHRETIYTITRSADVHDVCTIQPWQQDNDLPFPDDRDTLNDVSWGYRIAPGETVMVTTVSAHEWVLTHLTKETP